MAHRLEGWTAIAYAEKHGGTLKKYTDPTERALKRVSIEKAKRVAREDPRLIYMMVPHGKKSNPGKTVRLKNFTGTVRLNPNKTVSVVGRGKGGSRRNPSGAKYGVKFSWHAPIGAYSRRADAMAAAKRMRAANHQAGLKGGVKVVKVQA